MNRSRLVSLVLILCVLATARASASTRIKEIAPHDTGTGGRVPRIVDAYGSPTPGAASTKSASSLPQWVAEEARLSATQMKSEPWTYGLSDPEAELRPIAALRDDLGNTDVRLAQVHDGVEVFGGQLISHLDRGSRLTSVDGMVYRVRDVDTTPLFDGPKAVERAKRALGYTGDLETEPVATLVVLPRGVVTGDERAEGARLAYHVTLRARSAERTGNFEYFVDAKDGKILWAFDSLSSARGIGYGIYNHRVTFGMTDAGDGTYTMVDPDRAGSSTRDLITESTGDGELVVDRDGDGVWGNGTKYDSQSAAVDAHYGVQMAWDYFLETYGRYGADGAGTPVTARVHYSWNYNNAFGGDNFVTFGDGDGDEFDPLVSLDVVGHEFTHSVVQYSAGLIYANESGAVNESMADIFGTAIEFYANSSPDYLIGEDCITPRTPGDAMRDMTNPTFDHYSELYADGPCSPEYDDEGNTTNDNCYVHSYSGVSNKAFSLLAIGGRHPDSGITVPAIGRREAEGIFYVALTRHMFPASNFSRTAYATLAAAADLYGYPSSTYDAVRKAWLAVGVIQDNQAVDFTQWKAFGYASVYGSGSSGKIETNFDYTPLVTYPLASFTPGWSSVAGGTRDVFFYNRDNGAAAVGYVDAVGGLVTTRDFPEGYFGTGWTHVTQHEGSLFFYNQATRIGSIGRITGNINDPQYTQYSSLGGFGYWTNVVSAQGRLLFYDRYSGWLAVCDLEEVYRQNPGEFPSLVNVVFRNVASQRLSAGWDQVVDTRNGIMFYDADTGRYTVGDLNSAGRYDDRVAPLSPSGRPMWRYSNIGAFWTHIAVVKDCLLFYDSNTSNAMTGTTVRTATVIPGIRFGEPLVIKQPSVGGIPVGLTHLVGSVDPPLL